MENILILNFESPSHPYILSFEDNGKVAYAYLKEGNSIVGDVWLYNRCSTPEDPEWKDRGNMPFANSKGYMNENGKIDSVIGVDDVLVDWQEEDQGPVAYIYLFEELCGVVGINDKPGYARFAVKDSPIAKVMDIE